MPNPKLLMLARDFRERAEEALARAETCYDPNARQMMGRIAARYERLAQRIEMEANGAHES
jgi:hypothetical protein